jgi:UDP-N-acetylglucosamine diphosphorylase / glucose-1-phosphate thymidylyltransferase / UDP-N-acetylgalactosamine diphosphorylase / glucosamine-1-phosphate N-acetyltransferase / galactosamine-1-phosphate N-acetyltransferase
LKALLLAAGRSKRMKPVKDKNFLKFLGKPLIQHQLELLHRNGFEDIVVVGGAHNLGAIKKLGETLEMNLEYCEQENLELGMCGAVKSSIKFLSGAPVLILSSNDVVDDGAIKSVKEAFEAGEADSYILGKKVESYFPGGYLETDENGFIHNIIEKPGEGNEPSDLVNLVVHLHNDPDKLVDFLEKVESDADDIYEVALAAMMKDGVKFKSVAYDGFWQPIKFPWHVQKVFKHLFDKAEKSISSDAMISKNAVVNGEVIIEEGVKVFDGAVVNGPCYIGKGSIIATNALVRESNIGDNCVIGFSTEVARSFLGSDVWTHSNYIGDSVLGNNVSFGAGTVTGNLRLDERNIVVASDGQNFHTNSSKFGLICGDNVRFGINTSTMPGISVGGGSFIGAGIVISSNIPEKSFVRGSIELKISENKEDLSEMDRGNFKDNLNDK